MTSQAEGTNGNGKLSGYLDKKGKMSLPCAWKRYWFVLDGKFLMFYKSKNHYESLGTCKGCIDFNMAQAVRISKGSRFKSHQFQVITRTQIIHLSASDAEIRCMWVTALQNSIKLPQVSCPVLTDEYHPDKHLPRILTDENILKSSRTPSPSSSHQKLCNDDMDSGDKKPMDDEKPLVEIQPGGGSNAKLQNLSDENQNDRKIDENALTSKSESTNELHKKTTDLKSQPEGTPTSGSSAETKSDEPKLHNKVRSKTVNEANVQRNVQFDQGSMEDKQERLQEDSSEIVKRTIQPTVKESLTDEMKQDLQQTKDGTEQQKSKPTKDKTEQESVPANDRTVKQESEPTENGIKKLKSEPTMEGIKKQDSEPINGRTVKQESEKIMDETVKQGSAPMEDGIMKQESAPKEGGIMKQESEQTKEGNVKPESEPNVNGIEKQDSESIQGGIQLELESKEKRIKKQEPEPIVVGKDEATAENNVSSECDMQDMNCTKQLEKKVSDVDGRTDELKLCTDNENLAIDDENKCTTVKEAAQNIADESYKLKAGTTGVRFDKTHEDNKTSEDSKNEMKPNESFDSDEKGNNVKENNSEKNNSSVNVIKTICNTCKNSGEFVGQSNDKSEKLIDDEIQDLEQELKNLKQDINNLNIDTENNSSKQEKKDVIDQTRGSIKSINDDVLRKRNHNHDVIFNNNEEYEKVNAKSKRISTCEELEIEVQKMIELLNEPTSDDESSTKELFTNLKLEEEETGKLQVVMEEKVGKIVEISEESEECVSLHTEKEQTAELVSSFDLQEFMETLEKFNESNPKIYECSVRTKAGNPLSFAPS